MKTSVLIPTYNSERTIQATLDSVLAQTLPPDEILILDDGSTDNTVSLLRAYQPRITIRNQTNRGVAPARNTLSELAKGDLVAFLDHDDLWHPKYLETQCRLFENHPEAVAFFIGHVDFHGHGDYDWSKPSLALKREVELIDPLNFLKRYNETTGPFGSMSFCCVPKRVLNQIGREPFRVSGVDDSHLCMLLPLHGHVAYNPEPLVAYRITREAQSANRLRSIGLWVNVFELLEKTYDNVGDPKLNAAFRAAYATKRRCYGRILMGAGLFSQARTQFMKSAENSSDAISLTKSLLFWASTYMPIGLQPRWSSSDREQELARRQIEAEETPAVQSADNRVGK